MNGDDFVDQIQDVQKRVAELQEDASQLPLQQKSRLTESLERLTTALRDLQVAEEAIRLLLSAVQQSRDSIIITTAHLNLPGPEIVYVNPAFSEMTGYSTHEVLGKTPRILQGADTDRHLLDDLRQHLEDGEPFHGEAINYRKDGTEFFVEWNITPIRNVNQQVTHFVAIQRNISDRKLLEVEREHLLKQEHRARHQAEVANRTKDEFLATLSHELRTPLTPILGWSKVLQTKKLPQAKLQEALATIEQNAKRQAQLVDDLLDLSRIVQGKLHLDLAEVNFSEPIAAALATVRPAAEAKSISIATEFDLADAIVLGDAGRLQQIVWNLLSNAIKFTSAGGKVDVTLGVRRGLGIGDGSEPSSHVRLTISDTGKGIDRDFLPYVFDRFRQEDSSITRQFGGLGLGLSLVRQLVEAHGGTIAADSAGVGKGATFTVHLPLIAQSIEPIEPIEQPPADLKLNLQNVRVLVVEDEPSTLEFLAFVLEQEGAIVTATTSARDALDYLKRSRFDLLISDIAMQEMNGYGLIQQMRSLDSRGNSLTDANAKIPAIALTAYKAQSERDQVIAAGFQQHLAKPIEPEALIHAVAIAVGRPANSIT